MNVRFRTRQLERAFQESDRAIRRWGFTVARKYVARIIALKDAPDFAHIKAMGTLRAHPLRGERRGQWALDMTGRYRLIIEVSNDERDVTILEVSSHYGD